MRRLNIIALIVFLAGLVWIFTWPKERAIAIRTKVMSLFSPFVRSGAAVQDAVGGIAGKSRSRSELAVENVRLRRELEELKIFSEEYHKVKQENDDLRRMLDFSKTHPLKLLPARILTRNSATWWNAATIDRGLHDGLAPDLAVRTAEGLVGKVVQVSQRESQILFLTDETCRVAVRIEGTPDQGISSGIRGVAGRTPGLRITFLPREASVPVGAKVYTSGKGGIFPLGILLGEVTKFTTLDDGGEAQVKPAVDFDNIKYVFVVAQEPEAGDGKIPESKETR
ncbi:MAG: rod shape-determining protein MreC [Verrucomicrobiales bacterium]